MWWWCGDRMDGLRALVLYSTALNSDENEVIKIYSSWKKEPGGLESRGVAKRQPLQSMHTAGTFLFYSAFNILFFIFQFRYAFYLPLILWNFFKLKFSAFLALLVIWFYCHLRKTYYSFSYFYILNYHFYFPLCCFQFIALLLLVK